MTKSFAIQMKAPKAPAGPPAPMPPMPGAADDDEAGEDETGETCNATISADQLDELQQKGSVELQGDDGEKVMLTMDESDQEGAGEPPEPTE